MQTHIHSFILFACLLISSSAYALSAISFTLHGAPNTYQLLIAEPLDGAYNNKAATFKQIIKDRNEVKFVYKHNYPAILCVNIAGRSMKLIVVPNDDIHVDIFPQCNNDGWIVFKGANALGQRWLNAYNSANSFINIQKIFQQNKGNYSAIYAGVCNYVEKNLQQIDSLKAAGTMTDPFTRILTKNKLTEIYCFVINEYNRLLGG